MRFFLSSTAKKRLLATSRIEVFSSLKERFGTDYEELLEASRKEKILYKQVDQLFETIHEN